MKIFTIFLKALIWLLCICSAYSLAANSRYQDTKDMIEVMREQFPDLGSISKGDISGAYDVITTLDDHYMLRVFVSSSMTDNALVTYATQAKKYNAILVFRGLPNDSWRELSRLVEIIGKHDPNIAINIDDEVFAKFNITSVPSIVLSDERELTSQENASFDKVVGSIGIKGALELFEKDGDLNIVARDRLRSGL